MKAWKPVLSNQFFEEVESNLLVLADNRADAFQKSKTFLDKLSDREKKVLFPESNVFIEDVKAVGQDVVVNFA